MSSKLRLRDLRKMGISDLQNAVRSRTQSVYLGNNISLCRILGRYKFYVDTMDIGFAPHAMLDGYWEIWLTQFMARHLQPGMRVIDIGANFGYYSVLMSDLVSESGRCLSVEPNSTVAKWLSASLNINGFARRSEVAICAAGDGAQSTVRMFVPSHEPKNARVANVEDTSDANPGRMIDAPSRTVDKLCDGLGRIDFVKIDVEGSEQAVFAGMKGVVERHKPDIVMEFRYSRYSDPSNFLVEIKSHYPRLRYLDFDGHVRPISPDRLATEHPDEDWLLILSDKEQF